MIEITSPSNPKYKLFKSLSGKKGRSDSSLFTVEGLKSVTDAIKSPYAVYAVIVRDGFSDVPDVFDTPVYSMPDRLFSGLSDTKTPQGIIAVLKMRKTADFIPIPRGAYVYCDGVNDPGNMGTIIRTADAAGMDGVIVSRGSVDVYSPKTVRASMGSFFNIDIITDKTVDDLKGYMALGYRLLGGTLSDDSTDYRTADYTTPLIIAVGNEANGISAEVLELCEHIKIPIYGKAESLNAGVAAGILMYECVRADKG